MTLTLRQTGRSKTKWSLFGMALALLLLATAARAEDEKKCSDFTDDNRPCTATEELGFCQAIAIEALNDCREANPWYKEIGCWLLFEVDWHVCLLEFPIDAVTKLAK